MVFSSVSANDVVTGVVFSSDWLDEDENHELEVHFPTTDALIFPSSKAMKLPFWIIAAYTLPLKLFPWMAEPTFLLDGQLVVWYEAYALSYVVIWSPQKFMWVCSNPLSELSK